MVRLEIESSIWWAVVIFVAFSRFVSRRMTLGSVRRYQSDDYGMLVTLAFYTTLIVAINIVRHTNSNLLPPGFDVASLTPQEKSDREYGSKMVLVVEQSQCVTVWGAKICLLILYYRLTQLRWENLGIKILAGYVVVSFIVMEILYFGVWCRPFYEYWAVPTNSVQCDAATNHLITNATFNLSSDVILIAIGLPMFLRMKLPWQKKVPLVLVFSLGLFVILAAVLNKVYSFTQPFGNMWSYWYVRESSTALLVANLPFVWNFWRKICGYDTMLATVSASRRSATGLESALSDPNSRRNNSNSMLNLASFLAEWPPGSGQRQDVSQPDRVRPKSSIRARLEKSLSRDRVPQVPQKRGSTGTTESASSSDNNNNEMQLPRALLTNDKPAGQILRRDSDPDRRGGQQQQNRNVSASTTMPSSMASSKSAGSFV